MLRNFYSLFKVKLKHLRRLKINILPRRTPTTGGKIIAFVGVDGSGKSTLAADTLSWLSWKIDVQKLYFGSGSSERSKKRKFLGELLRFFTSVKRLSAKGKRKTESSPFNLPKSKKNLNEISVLGKLWLILWSVTVALEKRKKVSIAYRLKSRGYLVICDRIPQSMFNNVNDGPMLQDLTIESWWFDYIKTGK